MPEWGMDSKALSPENKASQALELLRLEAELHDNQTSQTSLLGRAVTGVTEFLHGSGRSAGQMEDLGRQIKQELGQGNKEGAEKLAQQVSQLVETDKKALSWQAEINTYGTGMVKAAGLFLPGRSGYLMTGAAYAADNIRAGDPLSTQVLDGTLGVTKGLVLKGAFNWLGQKDWSIAGKAVSLGVASRVSELVLSRLTYLDGQSGSYSARTGIERTLSQAFAPKALASDVITFGIAHGALSELNSATGNALRNSPFWSTVSVGGVFGLASGSVDEIARQSRAGESFDLAKVAQRALLRGATDMVAAAPGGMSMSSMQARALAASRPQPLQAEKDVQTIPAVPAEGSLLKPAGNASSTLEGQTALRLGNRDAISSGQPRGNFPGATAREYQLVGGELAIAEALSRSQSAFALTRVREIGQGGKLGPEQSLLIQHMDKGSKPIASIGKQADLVASCNPSMLPEFMRAKHVLPSAQESLWLTQASGGRLKFSINQPETATSGMNQSVRLGNRSVSDLLLDPRSPERLRDMHDLAALGKEMRHFKTPAKQIIDGGADSVVVELVDGRILKITDRPWTPEWGQRTVWTPDGYRRFDAKIIGKPTTIETPDGEAKYFIQERVRTPVDISQLQPFAAMLEADGKFKFWDNDFDWHGARQLGYVDLPGAKRGIVLIDYDAVRPPHLVPKQTENAGSWWPQRYLADLSPRQNGRNR